MSRKPEKTVIFSSLPLCKFRFSCIMIIAESENVNKCADWSSTKSALVSGVIKQNKQ
jgi:hypothetical protein